MPKLPLHQFTTVTLHQGRQVPVSLAQLSTTTLFSTSMGNIPGSNVLMPNF